jgi:arylsulfatase A-like enzyme
VIVVTDDQRWDMLGEMPTLQRELVGKGVTFLNAFTVNPECCPSRASILTGQYSHRTGVYTNDGETGIRAFDDSSTLATWLTAAGYRTGLVGKYLNHYKGPRPPRGWDYWVAYSGHPAYYDYTLTRNGVLRQHGDEPENYATDVLARRAVELIEATPPETPLFLYFAPFAPHPPAVAAPRHQDAGVELPPYDPPSYNEDDLADKPRWVQAVPELSAKQESLVALTREAQYRALLSVDEALRSILDALRSSGRLSRTMIVYLSDNGHAWGEHRWISKGVPYEEVIRIPLVIRYDPITSRALTSEKVVASIDVAPTVAEIAGMPPPEAEGQSLVPLLQGASEGFRSQLLIEHVYRTRRGGETPAAPTFCAVRAESAMYVRYETEEEELYLLDRDPQQLVNRAKNPTQRDMVEDLRQAAAEMCSPLPPGMTPFP